jgi:hypothetical protein
MAEGDKRGPGRDIFVAVAIAALTKAVEIGADQLREWLKRRDERKRREEAARGKSAI